MGKVFQTFVMGLFHLGFCQIALSQDLGSINSHFGSDKQGSVSKPSKTTKKVPKKAIS